MGSAARPPSIAVIEETTCIGCALCIDACPVDAIVGAAKFMHTVIAAECIGCRLCVPPCPVDCIAMVETGRVPTREEKKRTARHARSRIEARKQRLAAQLAARAASPLPADQSIKRATIDRAMRRARERLRSRKT